MHGCYWPKINGGGSSSKLVVAIAQCIIEATKTAKGGCIGDKFYSDSPRENGSTAVIDITNISDNFFVANKIWR
ncbi:hypothetical protein AP9108_33830 [Arthrospira sp. PCC 9108]|nr:hypothetical protein AP9108_33830 [Arthrospira sp. PCC 9108]